MTDIIYQIIKKLKRVNNKVRNIHQIRASVISNWLKKHNLRKVQVMAGHKSIRSTERYLQEDLKQLEDVIATYHPLNK